MRKTILAIHLILSLTLGLFVVLTCTTGSLLLIEPEVESWMHPVNHAATSGNVSPSVIKQHADSANPGFFTDRIEYPNNDPFYHVHLAQANGGKENFTVYADPGTGDTFGRVQVDRLEPFATIYQLHRYFLLTSVIGKVPAASVVGILGIALVLILVTGIYLWWPGLRKLATGFRVVLNRGKLLKNMSLHKTVGIISIPFLLVLALTGTINAFEKSIPTWVGFKAKEEIPATALQSKTKDAAALPLDRVVEIVKETYPTSELIKIQLPPKAGQSYQIGLQEGFSSSTGSNSTVYMDGSTGAILYKTNPNLAINLYNAWRKGLHFATWGGEPLKIISFFFGMTPLALMITGLFIWRIKANARKRSRNKSASSAAAAA
ncbi:PepSY domain-containing protein [Paenibacillus alba]|uniref:PepSY-associated TM helix domain-containing protein n=1 Tax=Paenibacillus alba TaxID=1197127 RepID=UPI001565AAA6|nr:PepSY-associated TM helix domain-containing protein [Paenibacillus alba]NQX68718.1 PepSY domain-containing protein [Paenibacillus alba]